MQQPASRFRQLPMAAAVAGLGLLYGLASASAETVAPAETAPQAQAEAQPQGQAETPPLPETQAQVQAPN